MSNHKSAKNLGTFQPKFEIPLVDFTESGHSDSFKSQFEDEKKESSKSSFANYSFFRIPSNLSNSNSSSGNNSKVSEAQKKFPRDSSQAQVPQGQ